MLFHMGFQKTGTTSIQSLLNENAADLSGIDIRAYGKATRDLREAGKSWCHSPSAAARQSIVSAVARYRDSLIASGRHACIVSDENILGRGEHGAHGYVLTWGEAILPIIAEAAKGVRPMFVFYTRSPEAWLRSLYNQLVKRARETATYEEWRRSLPYTVDWQVWHTRLQAATDAKVVFVSMEEELASDGWLGRTLLDKAGIPRETSASLRRPALRNPSLSERGLAIMRYVNRLPVPDKFVLRFSEALERREARRRT